MRIPFEITPECMQNADKTGSKGLGLINFVKHTKNNTSDGIKKEDQERAVREEKMAKFFGDGEDTMSVRAMNKFKSHRGSANNGIFIAAGRAEAAMASKRNKLKKSAARAGIKSPTKRRVTTV